MRFYGRGDCIIDHCSKVILADLVVRSNVFYLNVVYDEITMDGNIAGNVLILFC